MAEGFVTKERIYADQGGNVVAAGDPRAHHLLFGQGVEVSAAEAAEHGLDAATYGAREEDEPAPPAPVAPMTGAGSFPPAAPADDDDPGPATKAVAPAEDKAVTPAEAENKD